jgi:hypothetical protein
VHEACLGEKFQAVGCMELAGRLEVAVTDHLGSVWKALVSTVARGNSTTSIAVEVDVESFTVTCPCRSPEEYGGPCWHGMALIIEKDLRPHDPRRYNTCFSVSTYNEMYCAPVPPTGNTKIMVVGEAL